MKWAEFEKTEASLTIGSQGGQIIALCQTGLNEDSGDDKAFTQPLYVQVALKSMPGVRPGRSSHLACDR